MLKAQCAATVIISTAVLFYKTVKDDETALPDSDLEPRGVSNVLASVVAEEVSQLVFRFVADRKKDWGVK